MTMNILTGNLTFDSLCPPDLTSCTKKQLRDYFENGYDLDESLFTSLQDESVFYTCPDRLRLPLVFYLAHTASVYINKFMLCGLIKSWDTHFKMVSQDAQPGEAYARPPALGGSKFGQPGARKKSLTIYPSRP